MSDPRDYPGAPRWVKVTLAIVGILILLAVIAALAGIGGSHGPGRHAPSGDAGAGTPPAATQQPSP